MAPVLELRQVEIRYGRTPVVSGVTFEVAAGEFVTLLGASGSGKTSILRAIAGFVVPASGQVRLHGEAINRVPPFRRDIGMVFQNYALFPHMTVEQNLRFGLTMVGRPKREIADAIGEALAHVRLSDFRHRYPHQLSGGQQQRVAIARTLAIRPSLLLLDEPMSNLDARLRAEMRNDLIALLKRLGVTAISVTHNQEEALAMSDRIIVLREGRIGQIGTPSEIYARPADRFVAEFIGDANFISGRWLGTENGLARFESELGVPIHALASARGHAPSATLIIRPEAVALARGPEGPGVNRVPGRLASRTYMGAFTELRVAVGGRELLVKKPAGSEHADIAVGDAIVMSWDPAAVAVLNPAQPE